MIDYSPIHALLRAVAPLNLDTPMVVADKKTGMPVEHRFADEHEFVVKIPAWVFRKLKEKKP